jgi:ParB-like chromosome segregation protein Spo0J
MTGDRAEVALWPTCALIPSEAVLELEVKKLAQAIFGSGVWTHPIPVCVQSGLVMDGNHRLEAARYLGLKRVPVVPLSYESRRVRVRNRRDGAPFDLSRLDTVIRSGARLPYKTTRHEFEPSLPVTDITLDVLFAGAE